MATVAQVHGFAETAGRGYRVTPRGQVVVDSKVLRDRIAEVYRLTKQIVEIQRPPSRKVRYARLKTTRRK